MLVAGSAAAIVAKLGDRLGDLARSVQQILVTEIADLRDETQLLYDSAEGNIGRRVEHMTAPRRRGSTAR